MKDISQAELKSLLHYDPLTGVFFSWVKHNSLKHQKLVGCEAGCKVKLKCGYRWVVTVCGKRYYRYQLAFLWMVGYIPQEIDHKNTNSLDDSWENLRECTHIENCQNRENTSGKYKKGVSFHKKSGKFRARIKIAGKEKSLGYFDDEDSAHAAYTKAADKNFGDFNYARASS